MFTIGMKESKESEVELKEVKPEVLGLMMRYMYTGEVEVTIDNVQDVLAASNMLQLLDLKQACSSFLRHHIDAGNCLGIWTFSEMHDCPELMQEAEDYIFRKFPEVCQSEEFQMLSAQEMVKIVHSDKLRVKEEKQVLDAVMLWINHDIEERSQHTMRLMERVRLHSIPYPYLEEKLQNERVFQLSEPASYYMKGFIHGVSTIKEDSRNSSKRAPLEMMYVIGGRNKLRCLNTVERYCVDRSKWEMLPNMLDVRTAVGVATMGGKLYAAGGECECKYHRERTQYLGSVECYDPLTNEWNYIEPMKNSRSFAAVVSLEGMLYVIGGECSNNCYKSAEVYSPITGKWDSIPDMHTVRSGAGSATLGGVIYITGGQDRATAHSTVECYDPVEESWTYRAEMTYACSGLTMVSTQTHLFAFGGRSKTNHVYYNKIQRYTPTADIWEEVSTMIQARAWPSAVFFNNAIFIMGGYDGRDRLNTVERYDLRTGFRSPMDPMNENRAGCGASVV
jgi:hypothetical protein